MEDKEFEEKAIPLITEGFDLDNDAIEFLQSLSDKNIAVISIIGPPHSGKSFLANQIAGKFQNGFKIGGIENRTECCTRGIWIYAKPIIKENYYILVLDAQGLKSDTDENLEYSQKIFALCTLISSIVIYNYKNDDAIDDNTKISNEVFQQSYELFNKLTPFLEKMKVEDSEEIADENNLIKSNHIPKFYWMFRDYNIADFNVYKEVEDKIDNKLYNELFKNKVKKYSLPSPMDDSQMLVNAFLDEEEDQITYKDDYKKVFTAFKNELLENCKIKTIKDLSLNGNLFYGILQEYASSISCADGMFIESPLSNVVFSNLGEITENITDTFREQYEEKNKEVPDLIQQFKNSFDIFNDGLLNDYNNSFIGKLLNSQFMTEEMVKLLSSICDEITDTNMNEKLENYNNDIKNLTETLSAEKILKIDEIPDIKKNLLALSNNIKKNLDEVIFPKEKLFLSSFNLIKDYITKCICDKIGAYAESINFYIEHNLQTIESSSNLNELALEEKIAELNKKDSEIIELKSQIDVIKREKELKENEYNNNMKINKEINEEIEKNNQKLLDEKNDIIKDLQSKYEELNKELQKYFMDFKKKNDDVLNIKKENIDLKLLLGTKEKELAELKSKFANVDKNVLATAPVNTENGGKIKNLKEEDIPKLKELFKIIESTISEYAETVVKLEDNKNLFFYERFIEESKSSLKAATKNWSEELSCFKEEHFKTMYENYKSEISNLKTENSRLQRELDRTNIKLDEKTIEIMKLKETIDNDKYILDQKDTTIKQKNNLNDNLIKRMNIAEVQILEHQKLNKELESKFIECNSTLKMKEDEMDNTLNVFGIMCSKNKKLYNQNVKKLPDEVKNQLDLICKTYNLFKDSK